MAGKDYEDLAYNAGEDWANRYLPPKSGNARMGQFGVESNPLPFTQPMPSEDTFKMPPSSIGPEYKGGTNEELDRTKFPMESERRSPSPYSGPAFGEEQSMPIPKELADKPIPPPIDRGTFNGREVAMTPMDYIGTERYEGPMGTGGGSFTNTGPAKSAEMMESPWTAAWNNSPILREQYYRDVERANEPPMPTLRSDEDIHRQVQGVINQMGGRMSNREKSDLYKFFHTKAVSDHKEEMDWYNKSRELRATQGEFSPNMIRALSDRKQSDANARHLDMQTAILNETNPYVIQYKMAQTANELAQAQGQRSGAAYHDALGKYYLSMIQKPEYGIAREKYEKTMDLAKNAMTPKQQEELMVRANSQLAQDIAAINSNKGGNGGTANPAGQSAEVRYRMPPNQPVGVPWNFNGVMLVRDSNGNVNIANR